MQKTYEELVAEVERLTNKVESMENDIIFLKALRAAGVDNWDGYDIAIDLVDEWNEECN